MTRKFKDLKSQMVEGLFLLSAEDLKSLSNNHLRKLALHVCCSTCDQLQGYHSNGCRQLTKERHRRIKNKTMRNM